MKKNRLLAGVVVLLFICLAIFSPSINEIYNTTSKEIKDNLFEQKYLYRNMLFDANNGYLYTFEKNTGAVKNIYTNEQRTFEYRIKDENIAIRYKGDDEYDVYEIELYKERIRVILGGGKNIDMFFKDDQGESFDEFVFLESNNDKILSNINSNDITFFNGDKALISIGQSIIQFDYRISENILTLANQQDDYRFIGISRKQSENHDDSLIGLYLSYDIKNKLELNKDYGYLAIENKACEFTYSVFGHYILCESNDGNKFILDYSLKNSTLEIKILTYEKEKNNTYTFSKVS